MGFRLPGIRKVSFQIASKVVEVPKGYLAVYVGAKIEAFRYSSFILESTLLKKNLDMIIQWVALQFRAWRMLS
ncbi:hypothetical protein Lal_00029704 [Lupinus albus]|uniref:Uncharacterized protein n=1 Tax=Lupinus albus TaxID=3870 RepID=A0A6A5MPI1_LUPAL|nr:hypothetical protein Lalb_Chr07g0188321 [Lupinus albus]KAF1876356.1 hypothetical protein Lal_00029704 [Lupinus albus]